MRITAESLVVRPFETLRLDGKYVASDGATTLRVQRGQSDRWITFPLPVTTDQSGNFTAYVELGKTGRHLLRVMDPTRNAISNVISVTVS